VVAVGEVVGPHGLRGQVRVRAYQPPAPSLVAGRTILLEREGRRREATLTSVGRLGGGRVIVGLAGVGDRTAASALTGSRVLVPRADLPAPAAHEFYYHEVVGFCVETVGGQRVGEVAETMPTGLHDVWVVRDGSREHLVPVVAPVVRAIDRSARRIVIDPLPGLLD
jgi:16S rRNA processing protein RimM